MIKKVPDGSASHNHSAGSTSWEVLPLGPDWFEQFRIFEKDAFRLEVLQVYAAPSEQVALQKFLRDGTVDPSTMNEWCELVANHHTNGRSMSRVHAIDTPLSDYMRFEIEAGYRFTAKAGEEIFLLEKDTLDDETRKLLAEDFWLFDDSKVMVQEYSEAGALLHSRISVKESDVERYRAIRDTLKPLSEPFESVYYRLTGRHLG